MKILLCCEFDMGGAMAALWKALNKYTEHEARLITFRRTYLNYDEDIFDPCPARVQELVDWAEFYIIGEALSLRMQTQPVFDKIDAHNCILRAGGTIARTMPQMYMAGKLREIMKTGGFHDPTIAFKVFPLAPTVNMYEFSEWPQRQRQFGAEPVRLCFSGTAQKHQADHQGGFPEALRMLKDKYGDRIEFVNIQNKPWKECLAIKADCDILFDQFLLGAYGSSAIEGMYYRQPVFCYVSGWCRSIHPDVPLISVRSPQEIFDEAVRLIDHYPQRCVTGKLGREYVERVHSSINAITRWESLIDFVKNHYRR